MKTNPQKTKTQKTGHQTDSPLRYMKKLRELQGLTQKQVSEKIGCSEQSYCRYENGHRQPSIDTLIQLSDFYGVTVDELLGRDSAQRSLLSDYELQLVEYSRRVDPRARKDVLDFLTMRLADNSSGEETDT